MDHAYAFLTRNARNSAETIEQWKHDHDQAERVIVLEMLYREAFHLFREFVGWDEETELRATRERWTAERFEEHERRAKDLLRSLLRLYETLCLACEQGEAARYEHPVVDRKKLRGLTEVTRGLLQEDDQSYFDSPEVQEALAQAEAEIRASELDPF